MQPCRDRDGNARAGRGAAQTFSPEIFR
jgi:hypothetical protein